MNLGDEADSPWSDQRSTSPSSQQAAVANPPSEATTTQTSASAAVSSPAKAPGARAARTPRRGPAQATRLEAVADDTDPLLGPLAAAAPVQPDPHPPPALPQKEAPRNIKPAAPQSGRQRQFEEDGAFANTSRPDGGLTDGGKRPVIGPSQPPRHTFNITVGDPHKVGDLTGSHIAYQVRTKTNSKAFKQVEFEVSRRYKDFLWLYNQLHNSHPGTIVPPPPEKQAMGRYESDFVESRRAALERMLNKATSHMVLQEDPDLRLFLESEAFQVDVKNRERKDSDTPVESKGMFSGLNIAVGSNTKYIELDDWFLERRTYLDQLETQLKGLLKATDSAVAQRKNLSEASAELSTSLNSLSQVELSPTLTGPLASLSDLHLRIRDLYARQAQQDILTLSTVIDEYIRLIGSVKKAFEQRQKSWQGWHNAEQDLQKRRSALDKLHKQGRTQQDRIATLQADVADAERRAHQSRLTFEDLGRGMRLELERFEREKVEDFRMGVETYLESAVEAQKELIELWETYLMHLDADAEDEYGEPGAEEASTQRTANDQQLPPQHLTEVEPAEHDDAETLVQEPNITGTEHEHEHES